MRTALTLLLGLAGGQDRDEPPRAAAEILRDFHAVEMPLYSDGSTEEARRAFEEAIANGCRRKGELALELLRGHPRHPRVPELMATRWAGMNNALSEAELVLEEIQTHLERPRGDPLHTEALLARARAGLVLDRIPVERKLGWIEEAIAADPERELGGVYLMEVATEHLSDPAGMRAICERVIAAWPARPMPRRPRAVF